MAQVGSCCRIPSKVRRAYRNQYECSMATPRSNSACTLGSQEVGKLTLPSLSSWSANTTPLRPAMKLAVTIRCFAIMMTPSFGRAQASGPANGSRVIEEQAYGDALPVRLERCSMQTAKEQLNAHTSASLAPNQETPDDEATIQR